MAWRRVSGPTRAPLWWKKTPAAPLQHQLTPLLGQTTSRSRPTYRRELRGLHDFQVTHPRDQANTHRSRRLSWCRDPTLSLVRSMSSQNHLVWISLPVSSIFCLKVRTCDKWHAVLVEVNDGPWRVGAWRDLQVQVVLFTAGYQARSLGLGSCLVLCLSSDCPCQTWTQATAWLICSAFLPLNLPVVVQLTISTQLSQLLI